MFTNYSNELIDFVKNKKHNLSYNNTLKELYKFLETKYDNIYFKIQELDTKKTKKIVGLLRLHDIYSPSFH